MHGPMNVNPLNAELNPICYLQALLAHHFLHVSRIRVKGGNIFAVRSVPIDLSFEGEENDGSSVAWLCHL